HRLLDEPLPAGVRGLRAHWTNPGSSASSSITTSSPSSSTTFVGPAAPVADTAPLDSATVHDGGRSPKSPSAGSRSVGSSRIAIGVPGIGGGTGGGADGGATDAGGGGGGCREARSGSRDIGSRSGSRGGVAGGTELQSIEQPPSGVYDRGRDPGR